MAHEAPMEPGRAMPFARSVGDLGSRYETQLCDASGHARMRGDGTGACIRDGGVLRVSLRLETTSAAGVLTFSGEAVAFAVDK